MCARLEYDLRYQKEGQQWELLSKRGRKAPAWFSADTQLLPTEQLYLKAFWDLNSDRSMGMSVGPIPWSSIQRYASHLGLEHGNIETLHVVIRSMDEVFLRFLDEERERKNKASQ